MSEQLLIVILYHLEGFKNFKYYCKYAVEIKSSERLDKKVKDFENNADHFDPERNERRR